MQSSVERAPCESICWACIQEAWERRRGRGEGFVARARWILWTGFLLPFLLPLRCKDQHLRHFSFSWNTLFVIGLKSNQMQSWLVFAPFSALCGRHVFSSQLIAWGYCDWWIVIPPYGMIEALYCLRFDLSWTYYQYRRTQNFFWLTFATEYISPLIITNFIPISFAFRVKVLNFRLQNWSVDFSSKRIS